MAKLDMAQLKAYNPKLHATLSKNPELILDLQDSIVEPPVSEAGAAVGGGEEDVAAYQE